MLHAVSQGTVKPVTVSGTDPMTFPLIWMAASAVLPLAVFGVGPRSDR